METGLQADLIRVMASGDVPVVRATYAAGQRVA
jgi:alpha-D-ribose 1-methylphosphonate 5-triphosphate diphosphatase PhnM